VLAIYSLGPINASNALAARVGKNLFFFFLSPAWWFFLGFLGFIGFFLNFRPIKTIFLPVFVLFIYLLADEFKIREMNQ
jgi:hypothetical protein